jgi:riboflavin kinase/FMN adenylyltransferase
MSSPALSDPLLRAAEKGGVYALGNFDGVHRGHQAVVKAAVDKARLLNAPMHVLTFEPHPRSVLKPDIPPFRLTPAAAKVRLLKAAGADDVIVQPFTQEFLKISAEAFVEDILIKACAARHVVAGFDFVFGYRRTGTMRQLRAWLAPHSVDVTEVTPFRDAHGEIMSSSRAREALQQGDLATAEHILGRPWAISGLVAHGAQLGRELSVPTANIALGDYLRPKFGVYAVQACRVGDKIMKQGVANIGLRPTVDGKSETLEFHLFDFNEDIYGQEWSVELTAFIRPEQAFADLNALRTQILADIETAQTHFRA